MNGVKKLYSNEFNKLNRTFFKYLAIASKYDIGSDKRCYWESKAYGIKAEMESLRSRELHLYSEGV